MKSGYKSSEHSHIKSRKIRHLLLIRLGLLFKKNLQSPGFYVLLLCELAVFLLFGKAVFPTYENRNFGVYTEETVYGEQICRDLQAEFPDSCWIVDSREELEGLVESGELSAGFVLKEDMDRVIETGELLPCMEYISGTTAAAGTALTESVFAALLVYMDEQELERLAADPEIYSGEGSEKLLAAYHRYLSSDEVLQVYFGEVNGDEIRSVAAEEETADKRLAVCEILIFASALISAAGRFRKKRRRLTAVMAPGEHILWNGMEIYVPTLLSGAVLAAAWICSTEIADGAAGTVLLLLLVFCPLCSVYGEVLSYCFRKEAFYLFTVIGILLLAVIADTELIPSAALFPQLKGLGFFFPTGWF